MVKIYKLFCCVLLVCIFRTGNSQVLLSESFEGATFPPTGWTRINAGTGNNWGRVSNTQFSNAGLPFTAHDGSNVMLYSFNSTNNANAWMITAGVALTAGKSYTMSFYYTTAAELFEGDDIYPEKMKVTVGGAATINAQTTTLWDNNGDIDLFNTVDWEKGTFTYTPATTGTFYFGFNCYSDKDMGYMLVDDLTFQVTPTSAPSCVAAIKPANNAANVETYPFTTLKWTKNATADAYRIYISTSNPPLAGDTLDAGGTVTEDSLDILLPYSTKIYWYALPINKFGSPTGCKADSFTTRAAPPAPACAVNASPANNATGVSALPYLDLTWKKSNLATDYMLVFGATNPPTDTLGFFTDTTVSLTNLQYNTKYYWYVVPFNNDVIAPGGCTSSITSFTTQSPPAPPANDNCNSAVALTPNYITGITAGATQTLPADSCSGDKGVADDDIWYKFTPTNNGNATINVIPYGNFDFVVQGYSGSCGSLNKLTCRDAVGLGGAETLTLLNLVGGQTYYIRVFTYRDSLQNTGSFIINVSGTALPVSLTSFTGKRLPSNNVELLWSTASELNNKGFDIQRSIDGISYSSIGFIDSKSSNSSSTLTYDFVDAAPVSSTTYYRLQQVDKDGKTSLSNVVVIDGIKSTQLEVASVYPNPATSELNIIITSPDNDNVTLVVTDITGKTITTKAIKAIAGNNKTTINVNSLAKGSYLIKALCTKGCNSPVKKFVKD